MKSANTYYRALFALILASACILPIQAQTLDQEEQAFVSMLNAYRFQASAPRLRISEKLCLAASQMSEDLSTRSTFSHIDSHGRGLDDRLAAVGYRCRWAGENIASCAEWGMDVFECWRSSTGHEANMVYKEANEVGVARFQSPTTKRWYWTCILGCSSENNQPSFKPNPMTEASNSPLPDEFRIPLKQASAHLGLSYLAGNTGILMDFSKVGKKTDLVSDEAMVDASRAGSKIPMVAALDTLNPGDKFPSCLRIDFTGKCDFSQGLVVPINVTEDKGGPRYSLLSTLPGKNGCPKQVIRGFGSINYRGNWVVNFQGLGTALFGQFSINGISYDVWMQCPDCASDGSKDGYNLSISPTSDSTLYAEGTNGFTTYPLAVTQVGSTVSIHQKLYNVLYEDGTVVLKKYAGTVGQIDIAAPVQFGSSKMPITMLGAGKNDWPAGSYNLAWIRSLPNQQGTSFMIFYNRYASEVPELLRYSSDFEVQAGKTAKLPLFPFRVLLRAEAKSGKLTIQSRIATCDGRGNVAINSNNTIYGFVIKDAKGDELCRDMFKRSCGATPCPFEWSIPANTAWPLTVSIQPITGHDYPIEYEQVTVNRPD